jgi:hypothetical protein
MNQNFSQLIVTCDIGDFDWMYDENQKLLIN